MTNYSEFYFLSADGKTMIHANQWVPETPIRGVVQIAHGVAEYGKRYEPFAKFLCGHGFAVVANDHLGHGKSRIKDAPPLYFGEENGWWHVVEDLEQLRKRTAAEFPGKPYFLFGHSMGSFLSRSYLMKYPNTLNGCILCGTGNPSEATIKAGEFVVDHAIKKCGKQGYSKVADRLIFGSYNKKFKPNRTSSDWLSANEENVDTYLADPQCGGNISAGLLRDMLEGLEFVTNEANLAQMNPALPVMFIAGQDDPVGDMGKGVKKACEHFKKAGLKNVRLHLYDGMRHEILNEERKVNVYLDILDWLEEYTDEQG